MVSAAFLYGTNCRDAVLNRRVRKIRGDKIEGFSRVETTNFSAIFAISAVKDFGMSRALDRIDAARSFTAEYAENKIKGLSRLKELNFSAIFAISAVQDFGMSRVAGISQN